jgi:hypothetical protein
MDFGSARVDPTAGASYEIGKDDMIHVRGTDYASVWARDHAHCVGFLRNSDLSLTSIHIPDDHGVVLATGGKGSAIPAE